MNQFMMQYGLCILLCAAGFLLVILSYGAAHAGRSGVPFVGGFLIAVGFLTSPVKWLALLGLVDYGFWFFPYDILRHHLCERRFKAVYAQQDFAAGNRDDALTLRIWIPDRNEALLKPLVTNSIYELRVPRLLFAVCVDKAGKRFLLVDDCTKGGQIKITAFDENRIRLTGRTSDCAEMAVEVEIVRNKNR